MSSISAELSNVIYIFPHDEIRCLEKLVNRKKCFDLICLWEHSHPGILSLLLQT